MGGKPANCGELFFEPTILGEATLEMKMAHEETFGPVAALYRFKSDSEVIEKANNTDYGLAAYFYSQNHARIWRVAKALEVGMIGINEGMISTEIAPFGGVKYSGMGREGSKYGINDYLELKYLLLGGINFA
jgi:succinate-semialdehyde dehydrogenase/glutarate-semialdehyde dehydrogenase